MDERVTEPFCPRCAEERLRVNEMDLLECPHCQTQAQRIDRQGGLHVLPERGEGRFKRSI
jgi:Zn finger protein HypA/HybF involved in hydrogenase expression